MLIEVDRSGTPSGFAGILKSLSAKAGVEGLLILACDENGFTPGAVDGILASASLPLFGGIFPRIIHGKDVLQTGTIVAALSKKPLVRVVPNLSDPNVAFDDVIDFHAPVSAEARTMFVFVDGFARRIGALIDSLFNVFGLEFNYIGGGAGSLSMKQKPCLFTNAGLVMDSAVIAALDMKSGVGVAHGWESISGPYAVTESDRNVIKSLDWRPAFEVYRYVVEQSRAAPFDLNDFYGVAMNFPFGIDKIGAEKIVRDPLMKTEDDGLVCVGEVPQNSMIDILTADKDDLVDAAKKALAIGKATYGPAAKGCTTLFMDCISRFLFLKDDFHEELDAVYDPAAPLIGALTIGEIANCGKDYLEFYNKTAVVGVMEL